MTVVQSNLSVFYAALTRSGLAMDNKAGGDNAMHIRLVITVFICCFVVACSPHADISTPRKTHAARRIPGIVYIPTPHDVVDRMLDLAEVKSNDTVYDLGCGDGRIVVAAAKRYGCRAVGIDIDPRRIDEAQANAKKSAVDNLVEIKKQDLFGVDLRRATVATLYLNPSTNIRLIPQLNQMKPGSRVVSHQFNIKTTKPKRIVHVRSKEDGHIHTLYLWLTPLETVSQSMAPNRSVAKPSPPLNHLHGE